MLPAAVFPALQTPCVVGAISWFWGQESDTSVWQQRCIAMVAMAVGQLCPAGVGEMVFLGGWESGGGGHMYFGASDVLQLTTATTATTQIQQMAPAM
eukprot:12010261-Ditylum_brightwellii.AAC.1